MITITFLVIKTLPPVKKKLSVNGNRHAKFLGKVGEIDAFSTNSLFLGGQNVHQDVSKLHYIDFPNTYGSKTHPFEYC